MQRNRTRGKKEKKKRTSSHRIKEDSALSSVPLVNTVLHVLAWLKIDIKWKRTIASTSQVTPTCERDSQSLAMCMQS